jgi:PhoH-like ATPase
MARKKKTTKTFVLDTSVIIYAHDAIMNFDEHDVAIPITVLEELDNFKKGNDIKNFEAREFIRLIDKLSAGQNLQDWIPLNGEGRGKFKVLMESHGSIDTQAIFHENKPDHRILNAALKLKEDLKDRKVILVTKDVNLRLKAKSLDLSSEDYETGKIKNVSALYSGKSVYEDVNPELINVLYQDSRLDPSAILNGIAPVANSFFILKSIRKSGLAVYNAETKQLEPVEKRTIYGIKPKNAEQTFAINAILNPNVRLLSITGVAGTGKTLLALAGALEQKRNFKQIYLARPIVPLSNKDIGYLPGDIKSKLNPYMEPLWDNLKFIQNQYKESDREYKNLSDMVSNEKLVITPLAYIRGRSLSNICFIVDEAQNLTPHEVKTIISRAGENTKIIFTGDIFQIDTPYLDTQSNGLSYLIDRIQGHPLYAHVNLEKGERSDLANLANELL